MKSIETFYSRETNKTLWKTPEFEATEESACFSFWYHALGSSIGTLKFWLASKYSPDPLMLLYTTTNFDDRDIWPYEKSADILDWKYFQMTIKARQARTYQKLSIVMMYNRGETYQVRASWNPHGQSKTFQDCICNRWCTRQARHLPWFSYTTANDQTNYNHYNDNHWSTCRE